MTPQPVDTAALRRLLRESWADEQSDLSHDHLRSCRANFGVAIRSALPALLAERDALREALDEERLTDIIEQAIFDTDTGLEATLVAVENIRTALSEHPTPEKERP